jgi:hypothetical protein
MAFFENDKFLFVNYFLLAVFFYNKSIIFEKKDMNQKFSLCYYHYEKINHNIIEQIVDIEHLKSNRIRRNWAQDSFSSYQKLIAFTNLIYKFDSYFYRFF